MNAPYPLQAQLMAGQTPPPEEQEGINLVEYWDIIVDSRWLVLSVLLATLGLAVAYVMLARPTYEANLLVEVEDNTGNTKDLIGQAAGLIDTKTETTAEIEILRSRLVLGKAVDNARLTIDAAPRYLPIVGNAIARRSSSLSNPGFLGLSGYVTGNESITVPSFDVPKRFEGSTFTLVADGQGGYTLTHDDFPRPLQGKVGTPMTAAVSGGTINLLVSALNGKKGAEFTITRKSRLMAIEELQQKLNLAEKGRQSGIIEGKLQGPDPDLLAFVVNEIGRQYVRQNTERKAAEAAKTLAFLDTQVPQFKKQLRDAEDVYSSYRKQQGTVALDQEAQLILQQVVDLQGKLLDAQQRRRDLVSKFTPEHPSVKTLDEQIRGYTTALATLNDRIHRMPTTQQDALRLQRDVQVNDNLYQQLRNSALQLQLVREGKIGNVRVIDEAARPERPVSPNKVIVLAAALVLGTLGGVMLALARNAFFRGIRSAQEIEAHTNLNVYSTVPLSNMQQVLARKTAEKQPGVHVLAALQPDDPAIESLRSLRTALQFAMLDAPNNIILLTGATPGVGKSFISSNFAALLAASGKRVLLVDADLRKGHLNQYFGTSRARGLSELIVGTLKPADAVRRQLLPNLDLLTTGVLPPNPAELMMSSVLSGLLQQFSQQYDYVVLDTPPVLVAADTPAISTHAGTLLLVARAEETQMGELHESAKRLSHAGKAPTGVLLNALDLSRRHYGSYAYRYGGYRYKQYAYNQAQ